MCMVKFSVHAKLRLSERLGIDVPLDHDFEISGVFEFISVRLHSHTGKMLEYWGRFEDDGHDCVLCIESDTKTVVTVMTQGPIVQAVKRATETA